jgi:methylmalonyl-CoA/ethylmalonyl-CoA epimerase
MEIGMKEFAHIGICAKSVDATIEMLRATVGVSRVTYVDMPERGQRSAYVRVGDNGTLLELMEPLGDNGGTVASFLEKHGEGLHHLSFFVDSVEETAADFEAQGCRIIGKGTGVAFVHPKTAHGVLYELTDANYGK